MFKSQSLSVIALATGMVIVGCKKEEPTATTPPAVPAVPAAPTAGTTAKDATATVNAAAADSSAQATTLMEQVAQYIKDNKLDDAGTALKKLDDMKASLPASYHSKIDELHTLLDAAKAKGLLGGTKLPG